MRQNPFPRCLAAASFAAVRPGTTPVVHVLDIACPLDKLRDFMGDARQWLVWTMPALQSVQPLPFGQWLLKTSRHLLKMRFYPAASPDELHYELVVPGLGSCLALMHLDATPHGCQLTLTLHSYQQPPAFTTSEHYTFSGLQMLKLVLEQD